MKTIAECLVLLVEDDEADVELARRGLARHGFTPRFETARDGREALERLSAGPRPDLIVTDLKMPGMSGLELLEALKTAPAAAGVPAAVLTSSGEDRDRSEALRLGAAAYLLKPMTSEGYREIASALSKLLAGVVK